MLCYQISSLGSTPYTQGYGRALQIEGLGKGEKKKKKLVAEIKVSTKCAAVAPRKYISYSPLD